MGTSDAATHVTVSQLLRERGSPVSQTQHPLPQVTLQCSPARSGNELVFPYTVTNDGRDQSVWTYSGQVTLLAPAATLNVGLISNSVVPLDASVSVLVSK